MNLCKGCGLVKKLSKAHIIPESFFREIKKEDGDLSQYSKEYLGQPRRRPIGHYDKSILCRDCDNEFSVVDQYGAKTLIQRESEIQKYVSNGKIYYKLTTVDGVLFRRFLAAVLWRASISREGMFSQVMLGGVEEIARQIAIGERDPEVHQFAFIVTKYSPDKINNIVASPTKFRVEHMRFIRLFFPGYIIHVKTCGRPLPDQLASAQLGGDGDLQMVGRRLRDMDVVSEFVSLSKK